ncbi:ATP-binding cassette domain-containing protein [Salinibacterium sp. G-O1]|uniref:ATP-binding cassette domain-containing protein n=1 Tax=Salinibacterium sp. G-O1 TaxID=3046208 RepID=UPI0024BA653F|nr:ATP-binding cassette domain-containing protein [Salinibacterium sp. G-O1]MDJ0333850.1 ATP-binding cassette domain-containing protein [Salinibacterium sp. G-O1]
MLHGRLAPLRTAALIAGAFVLLRVVYRVMFGGAAGSGVTLADLPRIQLEGPFSHIGILGPITTGGLGAAALSALPFAGVILAFGVLGSAVNVRALLTKGAVRGPVRTISRALAIAWATLPALRDSVLRVRVARELRGERSLQSLIVPVLEHTVERALALGASMEVRGFAATRSAEPDCERPVVIQDAALGFAGEHTLSGISLNLAPGTLTLITGPTGSGKSTLLHAMSGLLQHYSEGEQRGSIEVAGADRASTPPRETAGFVGVVSQSVRLSFVAATVADELGFTLAVRGVAPVIVRARAEEIAERLLIAHLLGRPVEALSAGEACLVAIGAALVSHPVLLLVDEPLADLDTAARSRIVQTLNRLAHEAGVCVVVAEHNIAAWDGVVDARLELRDGTVHPADADADAPVTPRVPATEAGSVVAQLRHLRVAHGDRLAVDDVSLDLAAGEFVALCGPNGAGKSSLLHAVARPTKVGSVDVGGLDVSTLKPRLRRRAVALVPEEFDDLLFATTVDDELRRAGAHSREVFAGFLSDTERLMSRHPRDLSAGQRLCLVIAIQLSARPRVLLVDEPTRGLDAAARQLVGSALARAAESGTAVVVATHDADFAARFATRTISMAAGRVDRPSPAVAS